MSSKLARLQWVGNSHIPMPGGQILSSPMLAVIPCKYINEPYIAKAVKMVSSYVHSFWHNTGCLL